MIQDNESMYTLSDFSAPVCTQFRFKHGEQGGCYNFVSNLCFNNVGKENESNGMGQSIPFRTKLCQCTYQLVNQVIMVEGTMVEVSYLDDTHIAFDWLTLIAGIIAIQRLY